MPEDFKFDVFLSHSTKDKPMVRELALRLNRDGVRVWLDEEQIKPGDSIQAKIEEGLKHSRLLVLCMSASMFESEWAQMEANTFRFRDPLNKERRFIPIRLDDAPIEGSLAQLMHLDWGHAREHAYEALLMACRRNKKEPISFIRVRLTTINIASLRIGNNSRFEIKLEAVNDSSWTLGCTGLTINIPTINSLEIFKVLSIYTETSDTNHAGIYPPKNEIYGFFEDENMAAIGVKGKFGKAFAKNLLIENTYKTWNAHSIIWLRAILEGPTSILGTRLTMFLRVWANRPIEAEVGQIIADPDWNSSFAKDQQGIPAYTQSIGF